MNGNVLKYRGYSAIVEFSAEDQVLHGKIDGISDMVDFSSESAAEIEKEFQTAVDEYLAFCAEIGKAPDREYSGTFNVRIKPETHKQIAIRAAHEGRSRKNPAQSGRSHRRCLMYIRSLSAHVRCNCDVHTEAAAFVHCD